MLLRMFDEKKTLLIVKQEHDSYYDCDDFPEKKPDVMHIVPKAMDGLQYEVVTKNEEETLYTINL